MSKKATEFQKKEMSKIYRGNDESDDTEENAKSGFLAGVGNRSEEGKNV